MPNRTVFGLPLLVLCLGFSACPDPNALLQSYGYTPLRPPSTLLRVGTLVAITHTDPLQAKVICSAEASLGPHLRPMHSRTAGGMLKKLNNKSFSLGADFLSDLKGTQETRAVESVTVTLKNPIILELSDGDVIEGMAHRSPECAEAVRRRVAGGFVVSMISSALVGDLSYEVGFNYTAHEKLLPGEKAAAMMHLAGVLEGEVSDSLSSEIQATALVWAVRDDEYLSALAAENVREQDFARNTRHLAPSHVAAIEPGGTVAMKQIAPVPIEVDVGVAFDQP